jgi:hypothetical protein
MRPTNAVLVHCKGQLDSGTTVQPFLQKSIRLRKKIYGSHGARIAVVMAGGCTLKECGRCSFLPSTLMFVGPPSSPETVTGLRYS